jgi:hypothetical protein
MKGLLIKNMDDKFAASGNQFYETLKSQSRVFNETLNTVTQSRRGSSKSGSTMRPMTTGMKSTTRIHFNNIPTIVTNNKTDRAVESHDTDRLDDRNVSFSDFLLII